MNRAFHLLLLIVCCVVAALLLLAFRDPGFPVLSVPEQVTVYILDETYVDRKDQKGTEKYFKGYRIANRFDVADQEQRKRIVAALSAGADVEVSKTVMIPQMGFRAIERGLTVDYLVSLQNKCVVAFDDGRPNARKLTNQAEYALKY